MFLSHRKGMISHQLTLPLTRIRLKEISSLQQRFRFNREANIKLVFLRSVFPLLVTASVVPSSPIRLALMMEAILSSEISILTKTTQRNIPEDDGC
jgi:hypothetical protein